MNSKEIVELAKKRGLETGKAKKVDIIAAIQSGVVYTRADVINEGHADDNDMTPADAAEPLGRN